MKSAFLPLILSSFKSMSVLANLTSTRSLKRKEVPRICCPREAKGSRAHADVHHRARPQRFMQNLS